VSDRLAASAHADPASDSLCMEASQKCCKSRLGGGAELIALSTARALAFCAQVMCRATSLPRASAASGS